MQIKRFYDYDEIFKAADCLAIAKEIGMEPVTGGNMFNIPWREGSDSGALSINGDGWKDFVTGETGGALKLVARVKFSGDIQQSQQWLGDKLGLEVKMGVEKEQLKTRADFLIEGGYKLVREYLYSDISGKLLHIVQRLEHPEKKKEFVQTTASRTGSVKGIETVLYNLPMWAASDYVCICEGEKDCDTLTNMRLNATTNASGGGSWEPQYTESLKGKNVILIIDNDETGEKRCNFLLWELREVVNQIKTVHFTGEKDGFDITDYFEKHGADATTKLINDSPAFDKAKIRKPNEDYHALIAAKEANKYDFDNFTTYKVDGEKKVKPKQMAKMIKDLNNRFLGFPRRAGSSLFDHDRDTGKIEIIRKPEDLFSWMANKSKRLINWKSGLGFTPKNEFFAAIIQSATRYEEISHSPVWPNPKNVYAAYPDIPEPNDDCRSLKGLIDFFSPESPEHEMLLSAFFTAPIYYESGISRPCWIIDSECAGAGKTTLAEILGILYGNPPMRTKASELHNKWDELAKRIVSISGRQVRVLLLDNVTGTLYSPQFSDLITAGSISGRPPWGFGEETRPNNLTYVITANNATIDNDIAIRSYFINLKKVQYMNGWKEKMINYIKENRYQIMSDILYKIKNHKPFDLPPQTRFPEFEVKILQPFCEDEDQYNRVLKAINDARDSANIEKEIAERVEGIFERELLSINLQPKEKSYFVLSEVAEKWIDEAMPNAIKGNRIGYLRNIASQGFTTKIDGKISRIRGCSRRGFLWNKGIDDTPNSRLNIVGYIRPKEVGIL